jgi:indole-3-glycerol phosphate synthase
MPATGSVLDDIVAGVREDLARREAALPLNDLLAHLADAPAPRDPMPHFRSRGSSVIAEVKRRSPSKGDLADIPDPAALATAYARGGAAAISVLTEERRFGGSLADLRSVRAAVETPILRKDFFVDELQILEAQAAGADAILLIVAALDDATLRRLLAAADARGFAALVEVHTGDELTRALDAGARLVGVNSRNLKTLEVSLDTALALGARIGAGIVGVAESGIRTRADVDALRAVGYHAFLVGERFMRQPDPGAALAELMGDRP